LAQELNLASKILSYQHWTYLCQGLGTHAGAGRTHLRALTLFVHGRKAISLLVGGSIAVRLTSCLTSSEMYSALRLIRYVSKPAKQEVSRTVILRLSYSDSQCSQALLLPKRFGQRLPELGDFLLCASGHPDIGEEEGKLHKNVKLDG